ncbi:MAG TPA: hypothetical protein VGY31_12220 [Terriglobia bacterium]|nr:hypothetical protein [Terriglobia bacterium]
MPFDFQLRGLLRLRKIYEQRERMRLMVLNASRGRVRAEIDETASRREREFEALERRLEAGMAAEDVQLEEASLQLTYRRQQELVKLIEALDLQVSKQVEVFWESQKKRKVIESVRERQWKAYRLIEERREQQALDDLFAQRLETQSEP